MSIDSESLKPLVREIVKEVLAEEQIIKKNELEEALKKFSEPLVTKEDLAMVVKAFEKRFEQVDKRFEELIAQMDKRFEQVDKRFEQVDKRFEELIAQMDKRFEQVDKRFAEMNTRFERMVDELRKMIESLEKGFDKLRKDVHSMGSRFGRRLEKVVIEIMNSVVKEFGIDLEKAKRLVLKDEEGIVVSPGDVTDIDVYTKNGESYCIEVKASLDHHDVYKFYKTATVLVPKAKKGISCSKLVIVALEATERAREYCDEYDILLISGDDDY